MIFKAATWTRIHNYMSAFFLPLAILFIMTGALYMLGVHDTVKEQKIDFQFERSLLQDPVTLAAAVKDKLEENGMKMPAGVPVRKRDGYAWGKMNGVSVRLMPDLENGEFQLTVSTPGWYDDLMAAHKGKAGTLFKIFSILFAIALLLTYFSGVILALKNARARRPTQLAIAGGFLATVLLLILSL